MVATKLHSRRRRIRSTLGLALALPLAGLVLTLAACLPVAVGDPEKSSVDPALTGAWLAESGRGDRQMYLVHEYDKRTYLLQWFHYEMNAGRVQAKSTSQYKAWLTELGGERFVTLEPRSAQKLALPDGESPLQADNINYVVARLRLSDDGETLKVRALNPDAEPLNNVTARKDAEQVLRQHADNPDLYVQDKPVQLRKLADYDAEEIRSVLEAFHAE